MLLQKKEILNILVIVFGLLLIPLIAMQLTSEVNWKILDFLVMFFLLFITGVIIKMVSKSIKIKSQRILIVSIISILFLLIWAELAVGIFGTPFDGN